ncbi:hypothetical protein BCR37DRAFT_387415 [Protomyces lactucae-debilis]|uniref:Uncharacterized protein n=1 Tax=Protomyces lactucae-debilis TaxID=2754530 RepID=A0A1Y2FDC5_PROLT|nr:uncharacterized protein BCR37DRAFT_387415 [Protomyces lactucae-debilis]ORY81919.1 hypothetical protein BCR37DRAFT_387415 [Protomyces lactucae-debilis]
MKQLRRSFAAASKAVSTASSAKSNGIHSSAMTHTNKRSDELKPICGSCSRMHLSCGGWSTTLSKSEYAKQKTAFLELLKAGCAHRDARPPTIRRKRKAAVMEQGEASGQQQQGLLAGQENGSALVPSQNLTMMDDMLASTPRHPLHDSSQQGDRLGLPNLLDTTTPAFPRTAQVVADFQSRLDAALAIQGQQTQSASTLGTQTQPAHDDPATTNLFEMDPRTAATLQMAQQQAAIAQAQATLSYSDPATASSTPLDAQGAVLATSRDQVPYVPSITLSLSNGAWWTVARKWTRFQSTHAS